MNWWQALVLGIVEGVTEYLPISSTGHLILVAWLLGLSADQATWDAANTFNIVIQAGAIAAVLGLYRARVRQMLRGLLGRNPAGLRLAINLIIAFLPAAVIGPIFHDRIEHYLFRPWAVVGALFAGAWLMLAVAYSRSISHTGRRARDLDYITWQMALLIGFGQCIAMWPGTSRSMMTIVAALILGLRPRAAAEFSFLLGLITLTAATGYKALDGGQQMLEQFGPSSVAVGFIAATVSAALAVRWFVGFLTRHGLAPFGWYRLVIALVLAALLSAGWFTMPTP
ncbi:MAG: undecaprenyl-diphosphate phosphatase [Phycisphaeraceae bacterium]